MKPKPKIVYKYRSLSVDNFRFTHDIFVKNELYFPHPDQINDPFDCKIGPHTEDFTKDDLVEYCKSVARKVDDDGTRLRQAIVNINNTPRSELQRFLETEFKIHREVGVLSFTEKKLNILMWGHYADSHKGICIGFDYNKLFFGFDGTTLLIEGKINYPKDNKYPIWNPAANKGKVVEEAWLTKSLDWEYEQEWRIVLFEKPRTLQRINPDAIVSVHLGCKITKEHKETVTLWCSQREQKPKIYEVTVDKSSYSLKEREITY